MMHRRITDAEDATALVAGQVAVEAAGGSDFIGSSPGQDLAVVAWDAPDFRQHISKAHLSARSNGKITPLEDCVADLQGIVPRRVGYAVGLALMGIKMVRPSPTRRIRAGRNCVGRPDPREASTMHIDQPKVAAEGELGDTPLCDVISRDEDELRASEYCFDKRALKLACRVEHTEAPGCAVKPVGRRLTIPSRRIDRRTEKSGIVTEPMNSEKACSGWDGDDRQRSPGRPRRRERRCTARTGDHRSLPERRIPSGFFDECAALKQSPHRLPARARA
jgi:hypothetical protein